MTRERSLLVLAGILLLCCLPVTAQWVDIAIYAPASVHPGDTITYDVDVWSAMQLKWGMTYFDFGPWVDIYHVSQGCSGSGGSAACEENSLFYYRHYQFLGKVKSDTPVGTHLEVSSSGSYYSNEEDAVYFAWGNYDTEVIAGSNVPEFPGPAVPVILSLVFLGTVFLVRRTREN